MLDTAYYSTCSAARIADLVNAREVSAVEVMHSALGRLDEHEPTLRAFHSWWPETALCEAGQIDRRIARGERLPLAGVPLAVKAVEPLDSAQPARLQAAGCISLGATAVPGPGTPWRTWGHTDRGPTENPWVPGRTPGGSSAGSAVAVAARIVPLATGIDGAGSIRIPAAWCGVIGLKITNGLLGTRDRTGLAAPGPLCHDPGDALLYLDALLGASPADPDARLGTDPRLTRVGWSADLGFATVDAEQRAVARAALDRLIGAGLTERPCSLELRDAATAWTAVRTGNRHPAAHPDRAHNGRRLAQLFEVLDLLASPTTPGPPHPHSGPGPRINASLTWVFNLSGHPALSLPAGHDTQGRPVGLHLVARHGDERRLLTIATHYQRVSAESFSPPLLPGR